MSITHWFRKNRRVYMDNAAATAVSASVLSAMLPYFREQYGNPSAIYKEGAVAKAATQVAREKIAELLSARPDEILFTSGGTESNNLAILGTCDYVRTQGRDYADMHVITSAIEHPSVGNAVQALAQRGVAISVIPVDSEGRILMKELEAAIHDKTVLISVALVNGDIGVIQDIKRIAHIVRKLKKGNTHPYLHTDASQAPLYIDCNVHSLGVDLLTLDAAKMHGPKGVGVLFKKRKTNIAPILFGGSQEHGLRPGTESVPLIVGFGVAAAEARQKREVRIQQVTAVQRYFMKLLLDVPNAELNGSSDERIANNIHISVPGIDGEFAVVTLDEKGVAISTRSACLGADAKGSNVVCELGKSDTLAKGSLRFSISEDTTKQDCRYVADTLRNHVVQMSEALRNIDIT